MYSLTILETGSLKSRGRQGHVLSPGGCQPSLAFLGSQQHNSNIFPPPLPPAPSSHGHYPSVCLGNHLVSFSLHPCLCVSSPHLIKTPVLSDEEPTLLQYDFTLMYILILSLKSPFPYKVTFAGTQELRPQHTCWGDTI